jgi:hypothetical protein
MTATFCLALYLINGALCVGGMLFSYPQRSRTFFVQAPFLLAFMTFFLISYVGSLSATQSFDSLGLQYHGILFFQLLVLHAFLFVSKNVVATKPRIMGVLCRESTAWLIIVCLFICLALLYFRVGPPMFLNSTLVGNMSAFVDARTERLFDTEEGRYVYALGQEFAVLACIGLGFRKGFSQTSAKALSPRKWTTAITLALCVAISGYYLQKSRLAYLILAYFFPQIFFAGFKVRRLIKPVAVFCLLMVGYYWLLLASGQDQLLRISSQIIHRAFLIVPATSIEVLRIFPEIKHFYGGATMPDWFGLVGHHPVDISKEVYPYLYGDFRGTSPVPSIFSMYANYGGAGILASVVLNGVLTLFCSLLLSRREVWIVIFGLLLMFKLPRIWQTEYWFGILDLVGLLSILVIAVLIGVIVSAGSPQRRARKGVGN